MVGVFVKHPWSIRDMEAGSDKRLCHPVQLSTTKSTLCGSASEASKAGLWSPQEHVTLQGDSRT